MIGLRSGRLEVIDIFSKENKQGKKVKYYLCRCDCGNEKMIRADGVRSNRTKSCGCFFKEQSAIKAKAMGSNNKKHGMSQNRIYKIWDGMRERCNNPNNEAYKHYGARGITYDSNWDNFESFYADMKEGYTDELTLERKDINGNYNKENCTWVTMLEQQGNKQNTIYLTLNGEIKRIQDWAILFKIPVQTLKSRKRRGWSDFDILTKPIRNKN